MCTSVKSKPRFCYEFEVEKVIGVSSDGNYQVKWAPAWVSKSHLVGCEYLIQEFLEQQAENEIQLNQVVQVMPDVARDTIACDYGGQEFPKHQCENDIGKWNTEENLMENLAGQCCGENPVHPKDFSADIDDSCCETNDETEADDTTDPTSSHLSSFTLGRREESSIVEKSGKTVDQLLESWVSSSKSVGSVSITQESQQQPEFYRVAKPENRDRELGNLLNNSLGFSQQSLKEEITPDLQPCIEYLPIEKEDSQCEAGQSESNASNVSQSPKIAIDISDNDNVSHPPTTIEQKLEQKPIIDTASLMLDIGLSKEGHNDEDCVSTANSNDPSTLGIDDPLNQPETSERSVTEMPLSDSTEDVLKHTCIICQKGFSTALKLKHHVKTHGKEKLWKCPECDYQARCYSGLSCHFRTHTGEKPYSCTYCPKSFKRKETLVRHFSAHTGAEPYSCLRCLKSFKRKDRLTKHLCANTVEKPYSCACCEKKFASDDLLRIHVRRTHTGERPHKCNFCDKSFFTQYDLTRHTLKYHTLTHTVEQPLCCQGCGKSFINSKNYKKHIRCCSRFKQ